MSGYGCHLIGNILLGIAGLLIVVLLLPYLFPEVPRLDSAVKESKTIWGLWYTGDRVRKKKLLRKYDAFRKLIVLEPNADNPSLIESAREGHGSVMGTIREIKLLTCEVYKQKQSGKRIALKYITERPDESFTIFEPAVKNVQKISQFSDGAKVVVSYPWNLPVNRRSNRMYENKGDYKTEFMHKQRHFKRLGRMQDTRPNER